MKKLIVSVFVGIVLITWFYKGWKATPTLKKAEVVVVAYYTEPCEECPALEHTIRRLDWFFGREPIAFYAFNPANQREAHQIQAILTTHGIWKEAQKEYLKGTASVFLLKNKQKVASFKASEELDKVEYLIRQALK